jgi:hypothetical protein
MVCFTSEERASGARWMGLAGCHSQSGCCAEKKNLFPCWESNYSFCSPVTIWIELCSVSYYMSGTQIFHRIIISSVDISSSVCLTKSGTTSVPKEKGRKCSSRD